MKLPNFLHRERPAGFPLHQTRQQRLANEKRKIVLKKLIRLGFILWVIISTIITLSSVVHFFNTHELRSPIVEKKIVSPTPIVKPSLTPTPKEENVDISPEPRRLNLVPKAEASTRLPVAEAMLEGHVSHYSHAGCLGCNENQIMGNGQPFDENAFTLAVPCELIHNKSVIYNTKVRVENLDNGKSVEATITDCGGFSKYNRIADLSLAMANTLGTKTDVSNVRIIAL